MYSVKLTLLNKVFGCQFELYDRLCVTSIRERKQMGSSVSAVTRLRAGHPRNRGSTPDMYNRCTVPEALGPSSPVTGGKAMRHAAGHSPHRPVQNLQMRGAVPTFTHTSSLCEQGHIYE